MLGLCSTIPFGPSHLTPGADVAGDSIPSSRVSDRTCDSSIAPHSP